MIVNNSLIILLLKHICLYHGIVYDIFTSFGNEALKKFSLEKEMAAHSNILAWEISWTEDPGGQQQCMGLQKSQTRLSDWTT